MQVAETVPVRFARHGQVAVARSLDFPAIHVGALRPEQQADLIFSIHRMPLVRIGRADRGGQGRRRLG